MEQKDIKAVYFVGIGGIGMSAIARYFLRMGLVVAGYDKTPSPLTRQMEKEGALGQLVQLGERFVPQLLDRAQVSADGSYDPSVLDSLKPEDVYISFIVNYFDHLGQYVNDTIITVPCQSPKFGGNCLETDKKVFVNWNFKDHKGRFVGTGVYNVQFKMVVRYEDKKIVEEIKDKWGVRRKKHKK